MEYKTVNIDIGVFYLWYDNRHVLEETGEAEIVTKAIENGDFETFMKIYAKYQPNYDNDFFFPSTADIFYQDQLIGEIDIINPLGFSLITDSQCECG